MKMVSSLNFSTRISKSSLLLILVVFFHSTCFAQIWKEQKPVRLDSTTYNLTIQYWQSVHSDILDVEQIATTWEQAPIYVLRITDKSVPDSNKQIALISALHGGPEESGSTGALTVADWLLGKSKEAAEVRRKQIVLILPVMNPFGLFTKAKTGNSKNVEAYTGGGLNAWDIHTLTHKRANESPELTGYFQLLDKYQPDVQLDLHGVGTRSFEGQMMFEVTGTAYSNYSLRPWDWRIGDEIIKAGNKAGYPSDRGEADAQQMLYGTGMDKMASAWWRGRAFFYSAQYGYVKYHTLQSTLEVGWEQSALERTKGLLRIGNKPWFDEKYAGYPVNRVKAFIGRYVTAYGNTAAATRKSRVELWQKQGLFSVGVLYPQAEGRETFVVGLTEAGNKMLHSHKDSFLLKIRDDETVSINEVTDFIKKGPEAKLSFEMPGKDSFHLQKGAIENGIGFRLRLQYKDAKINELRLNGNLLSKSATDGYEAWVGDGFLQVQINVPPEKSKKMQIAIVTCEFSSKTKRSYGWEAPKAVQDMLKGTKK